MYCNGLDYIIATRCNTFPFPLYPFKKDLKYPPPKSDRWLKDILHLVCTHPIFLHLSKVPSVSVSEIRHIPISRCSAVSRLDRIRMLWRCMLPQGVWNQQRCVASGTAGHRTALGSYSTEWKRGPFWASVAGRFVTYASYGRRRWKT